MLCGARKNKHESDDLDAATPTRSHLAVVRVEVGDAGLSDEERPIVHGRRVAADGELRLARRGARDARGRRRRAVGRVAAAVAGVVVVRRRVRRGRDVVVDVVEVEVPAVLAHLAHVDPVLCFVFRRSFAVDGFGSTEERRARRRRERAAPRTRDGAKATARKEKERQDGRIEATSGSRRRGDGSNQVADAPPRRARRVEPRRGRRDRSGPVTDSSAGVCIYAFCFEG